MPTPLSPAKLRSARRSFNAFNILNSFSFVFVSGSFLTLFALRLGASKALIGVLNSVGYATFFFLPLGKRILRKRPIVWVFGWGWVGRYAALIPAVFAPALAAAGHPGAAAGLVLAGAFGFAVFRGIALIGNNPVVDNLATGGGEKPRSDRGAFMVGMSIVNSISSMAAGLVVAVWLGEKAGPWTYAIAMAFGIGVGFAGCVLLLRTPEPLSYKEQESGSVVQSTREALGDPAFRRFLSIFMVLAFIGGMARSFLPVYAKDAFGQGDDAVMVYSLLGSLGSVAMGLITRLVVDRLGSKPLFIIYSGVALLSLLPIALIPGGASVVRSPTMVGLLLTFVHFVSYFGFAGEESAGQTYYFALIPKKKMLDLGIVYYLAYGLGGALGSGLGGVVLDLLGKAGLGLNTAYQVFYALLGAALLVVIISMNKLRRLGAASIAKSLSVMFSVRDLRAFDLLSRLDRSADPREEVKLIHEIGNSASTLSQSELAGYLSSPRFEVRMEALLALENMPVLDQKLVRPLLNEVERHVFTTAYVAARVLGKHNRLEALPALRKAVGAEDYMLQGTAMTALARIGDLESAPLIESVLTSATNPRVRIAAAYALELMGRESSLPALASSLKFDDPPAFVSDEIVLAMASIIGVLAEFYPLYSAFIDDHEHGISLLGSSASDAFGESPGRRAWEEAANALFRAGNPDGRPMAAFLVEAGLDNAVELVLHEAVIDPDLSYDGLRFLVAAFPVLTAGKAP